MLTDEYGIADFNDFKILRGPEGLYTFKFVTNNFEEVQSDVFQIFMVSNVGSIEVLNEPPFNEE